MRQQQARTRAQGAAPPLPGQRVARGKTESCPTPACLHTHTDEQMVGSHVLSNGCFRTCLNTYSATAAISSSSRVPSQAGMAPLPFSTCAPTDGVRGVTGFEGRAWGDGQMLFGLPRLTRPGH